MKVFVQDRSAKRGGDLAWHYQTLNRRASPQALRCPSKSLQETCSSNTLYTTLIASLRVHLASRSFPWISSHPNYGRQGEGG